MNIPSLPLGKFIDEQTNDMSQEWRQFLDLLVNALQTNASNEGLVAPSQSTTNIGIIAAHQLQNLSYTTAGGQMIYDNVTNEFKVAILSGGVPSFKVVTVT